MACVMQTLHIIWNLEEMKVRDATPEEAKAWREEDYWNRMDFDPLVMFVVIPTVVQVTVMGMMFAVMYLNQLIF